MSGEQHIFQVNSSLPPKALKPVGDTKTGYGPAPYLSPIAGDTGPIDGGTDITTANLDHCNADLASPIFLDELSNEHSGPNAEENARHSSWMIGKGLKNMKTIDVIADHPWSHSPKTAMTGDNDDVPMISLMEHRILQNVALNTMIYNISTLTDLNANLANSAMDAAKSGVDKALSLADTMLGEEVDGSISAYARETLGVLGGKTKQAIEAFKAKDTKDAKYNINKYMAPYQRLYATFPSGFKYKFPYFTDEYKSTSPLFSDESGHTNMPFQKFMGSASEMLGSVVKALNTSQSGTYIESPKYPNFPAESKQYTFNFPLLNTVSAEHTQKNWELIFMLIYQNTPNRVNRSVIAPPHIYEALIPGVWYSRYSYISRLDVNMVGARRKMKVKLHESFKKLNAGFENTHIETLIPDAYQVSITVNELIPEAQNHMMESLRLNEIVEVYSATDSDNSLGDAVNLEGSLTNISAAAEGADVANLANINGLSMSDAREAIRAGF